ncbi:MAG TPA: hypothetical protein DGG95_14735 [Cytophagales bacterium]|jgi:hypothetical protein|nr:hypothetical protein [Cytophagales bacterium]
MRHILLWGLLCLVFSENSLAQRGLFLLGGFEGGGNVSRYNFKQNGNILDYGITRDNDDDPKKIDSEDGHRKGSHWTLKTSMYYRFSRRFGIEAGLMRNYIDFAFRDNRFQSATQDYDHGEFDPSVSYTSKYLAAHYYLQDRYGLGIQLFFGGGVAFNRTAQYSDLRSYSDKTNNETLVMNGHFTQDFVSPFIETGLFFYSPHRKTRSFLSFKYSFAPTLFSGDYQVTQNNSVLYQDAVSAKGNALTVSYSWGLSLTKPKEKFYPTHYSAKHYHSVKYHPQKKHDINKDVLKARLLGCFGEEKGTQASFWLYENKTRYFLEKLDSNLNRVFARELSLKTDQSGLGKHDWVHAKNLMVKDKITLFTSSGNAESTFIKITAHQFSLNGVENRNVVNVFQLKGGMQSYVHVAWSTDSSKVGVVVFQPISKRNVTNKLFIKTFDRNLNLLSNAVVELPSQDNFVSNFIWLSEVTMNNKGELFFSFHQYDKKAAQPKFSVWAFTPDRKNISEINLGLNRISDILLYTNHRDETKVVGYYADINSRNQYKGIFFGKINPSLFRADDMKLYNLTNENEPGPKSKHQHLKFLSLVSYKTGIILATEELGPYGGVHTFTSITDKGEFKYVSTLNKLSHPLFNYFPTFNNSKNSLNLIFNERIKGLRLNESDEFHRRLKNNGVKVTPVLVTFDSLGNQTKSLLSTNDSTKTRWIPFLSYQTAGNATILVGKLKGKYRRTKVKVPNP